MANHQSASTSSSGTPLPTERPGERPGRSPAPGSQPFVLDLEGIRARAREKMTEGAVTQAYKADRERVIAVLNEALATEIVCVLRYKGHHFMAQGIHAESIAAEFLAHANEEQVHADTIAARINQLGGVPNLNPDGLAARSHTEYGETTELDAMIKENLIAERIAIETYSEIVRWLANDDPTTRRMIEDILKVEEEHAEDMATLLRGLGKATHKS